MRERKRKRERVREKKEERNGVKEMVWFSSHNLSRIIDWSRRKKERKKERREKEE